MKTAWSGDVDGALASATEMRFFHGPGASFPGASMVASLGVNNIAAVPVPAALALVALSPWRRGRGRRQGRA